MEYEMSYLSPERAKATISKPRLIRMNTSSKNTQWDRSEGKFHSIADDKIIVSSFRWAMACFLHGRERKL
jgi:hypothetical protein